MVEDLKRAVCFANKQLDKYNLVKLSWGNVSGIDRKQGLIVIKPSGVPFEELTPESMVVLDMNGKKVEGELRPSSDAPTHVVLYNSFSYIGGIAHTHSHWATVWAQSGRSIPPYGTTHADFAFGEIPCTRPLSKIQIKSDYEEFTGKLIAQCFNGVNINASDIPATLVHSHGPFTWGRNCFEAVENSYILEEVARLAWETELLGNAKPIDPALLEKHFQRKHGNNAYYGQR
ncbi:MAG TPA: L-ribulose-5-phosphate 4-epimerase AraD [Clostridia bacterium]|nr:L-ribulose-5-phosphate 4-epimerase AraD [Clostridia bacterium]